MKRPIDIILASIILLLSIILLAVVIVAKNKVKSYGDFEIIIEVPITVDSVSINPSNITIDSNSSAMLEAIIEPETAILKDVKWESSNPIVARVDQGGKVTGVMPGEATITAITYDGEKRATANVMVISDNKTIDSYNSDSLKYWIEYIEGAERVAYHEENEIQNKSTYMITHLWVEDPYNQIKTAITPKQKPNQVNEYPRTLEPGLTIINREIESKGYQNKGLVAINASGMISHTKDPVTGESTGFGTSLPVEYYGTSRVALQIYEGKVIVDLTNTEYATVGSRVVFVDKLGNLDYRSFTSNLEKNKSLKKEIDDLDVKYTFGLISPYVLINDYKIVKNSNNTLATRQSICQIDRNNFIIITSHLNGKSAETNCGEENELNCPRKINGLSILDVLNIMINYNCRIGLNLDGGGSVSYYYKTNENTNATRVDVAATERPTSDVLYFVEK